MTMKKFILIITAVIAATAITACSGQKDGASYEYPFQNPGLSVEERTENLISLLTLEEKVGMMMYTSAAVERLGIPEYNWWNEALHGVARSGNATVFPQAVGMAAAFDDELHQDIFTVISDEARAKYNDAVANGKYAQYYGLTFWTPNINIFRDPRWGRGQETYGEDPYLTSRYGTAAVRGLQGNDPNFYKTHACAKHFAVHSGPEADRHRFDASVSMRDLWETYLPAFRALVNADVQEVMCAYNRYEGDPCCTSDRLLVDILRNRWGYDEIITSDCWAIDDFFVPGRHETHSSAAEASASAVLSGDDLECGSSYKALVEAVKEGLISEADIDVSLRRIISGRIELGILDKVDNTPWAGMDLSDVDTREHRDLALRSARESMVLLKNEGNVLPLGKGIKKLAVIGANADDAQMQWGNYNGTPTHTVTILDGIKAKLPAAEIITLPGMSLVNNLVRSQQAINIKSGSEQGFTAKYYLSNDFSGEPVFDGIQEQLSFAAGNTPFAPNVPLDHFSAKYQGTYIAPFTGELTIHLQCVGKHNVVFGGKTISKVNSLDRESMMDFYRGKTFTVKVEEGRSYPIDIDYVAAGERNSLVFDLYEDHAITEEFINELVKDADAIVYVGGISPKLEGEEMFVNVEGFSGGDRTAIDLPAVQRNILATLHNTGKPVVCVLCSGSTFALTNVNEYYDALLQAWYPGQEGGTAVADVLFGDYNPGGRMPLTSYKDISQLPDFSDYNMEGRTYRYMKDEPMYAFGYGLSYTTFEYGDAKLSKKSASKSDCKVSIKIPISNTGAMDGDEVVQVYIKSLDNPEAPVKSLKGFKRVHLAAGSSSNVQIDLTPEAFEYYCAEKDDLDVFTGRYQILYGSSSRNEDLKSLEFVVK